eukprot:74368-Lingulodinium_polyedra.AAC.1
MDRNQNDTRQRYKSMVETHGIIANARSKPVAVPVGDEYHLVAGATLAEAAYAAFSDPTNANNVL